jgi:MFS family permease
MKAAGLGCLGFVLGAIVGGVIGMVLGFVWINVFQTSDIQTNDVEDYSGMLVFLTFMPIGAIIGGILGAAALATVVLRVEPAPPLVSPGTKNPPD